MELAMDEDLIAGVYHLKSEYANGFDFYLLVEILKCPAEGVVTSRVVLRGTAKLYPNGYV